MFVDPGHKALEIFVKSLVIAIMIPGLIGSAIVVFLPFALPVYAEGDCPTISNKDGRNCQNPHDNSFAGAPPTPACGHKNSFKNSHICRAE